MCDDCMWHLLAMSVCHSHTSGSKFFFRGVVARISAVCAFMPGCSSLLWSLGRSKLHCFILADNPPGEKLWTVWMGAISHAMKTQPGWPRISLHMLLQKCHHKVFTVRWQSCIDAWMQRELRATENSKHAHVWKYSALQVWWAQFKNMSKKVHQSRLN